MQWWYGRSDLSVHRISAPRAREGALTAIPLLVAHADHL